MLSGWKKKYAEIRKEFGYSEKKDRDSAFILDSILKKTPIERKIAGMIKGKTVIVIGAGPSLSRSIPKLQKLKNTIKIAADSSVKLLVENKIIPDIVVTDLDGDEYSLKKIGKTKTIFVVHAHGDNSEKLDFVKFFTNYIGTTQTKPFGKIKNYGGFTDGDRSVFLANHFSAKKIILFGMEFGNRIGSFSNTRKIDRKIKLQKLKKAKSLLEWMSTSSKSELYTVSGKIQGFKKITSRDLDIIIT